MKIAGLLIILGVVLLLAGGVYLFTKQAPASNPPPATNPPASSPPPATNPSTSQVYNITISGFAFSPSTLNIKAGDSVTWTNLDPTTHTITSDAGTELQSSGISRAQTYTHVFSTAGTFAYHCSIHTTMKGTIIVS